MNQLNLNNFKIYSIKIVCQASNSFEIGPFWGDEIHRALGRSLRNKYCITGAKTCNKCIESDFCNYKKIFMFSPPKSHSDYHKYSDPPQPLILRKSIFQKSIISKGDVFSFELSIIGMAVEYYFPLIRAFEEIGQKGFSSKNQGKYIITQILQFDDIMGSSTKILNNDKPNNIDLKSIPKILEISSNFLLEFNTPFYLLEKGKTISRPSPNIIIERLHERISLLNHFYCDGDMPEKNEFTSLKLNACYDLVGVAIERIKKVPKNSNTIIGQLGKINISGQLNDVITLLLIGQWVHIGKMAALGLGTYKINSAGFSQST